MSDRSMRLKYLTKMKIILCIFLLYITAASVFGEPQELNGILGESVKFPAAVKIEGSLMHSSVTLGDVASGRFTVLRNEKFSGRVQWDSSTGFFSLSELKMEDSGVYTVQDTQQNIITIFQLNVWKDNVPVSKPNVIFHNEYCTIECTAERGTEATLSWYREGQTKPYVSSRVESAPHLHLPQTVERSGTYTCEVKNSVSNEKASITVEPHCAAERELNSILGESVKFPAAVKIEGSLRYSTLTIGTVISGRFWRGRNVEYSSRLQWDSSTGLFSLSELRMEDSGVYTVQDTQQNINTVFQLNVYINVSKPHVNVTHDEYPCTLLCTVERGTGVTLSWHREGQKKPYVTSPVQSAPRLHLPVPVEGRGTYTCEVKNSVSIEKASITVGAHCTAPTAERELNSIVGESVKFPAAVKTSGNLMYSSKVIGHVLSEAFISLTDLEYQGRVQWDSSTGLFSLSGLKMEDSGEYTVQNTDQNIITIFQLNVYNSNTWMIVAIVFGLIAVAVPVPMAFLGVYLYRKGCCRKNDVIFDGSTAQAFLEMQKNQERGS